MCVWRGFMQMHVFVQVCICVEWVQVYMRVHMPVLTLMHRPICKSHICLT